MTGQLCHTPSGTISREYRRKGLPTIETALPSGPHSDEAVDEEDLRQKTKALNLVIAAMTQPSQLRVEIVELSRQTYGDGSVFLSVGFDNTVFDLTKV
jgi:hypothetical protein